MTYLVHDCPACGRRVEYCVESTTRPRWFSNAPMPYRQCVHCRRWVRISIVETERCPFCDCPRGGFY